MSHVRLPAHGGCSPRVFSASPAAAPKRARVSTSSSSPSIPSAPTIGESDIFRGTLSRAAVEPRAILKEALLRSASGFVLFHTHPSGDPSPSSEDLSFTRRMAEAGELVGVRLLDHLILGSAGRWVSLGRRGAW